MNDLKGIIEDCNKSDLVSDKVIKKVVEIIGQEEWQDLHDEYNDVCTTMGELIITLKGIAELEEERNDYRDKYETVKNESEVKIAELEAIVRNTKAVDESFTLQTMQLTKAKELFKKIERIFYNGEEPLKRLPKIYAVLVEAEQFLKDSEVEK